MDSSSDKDIKIHDPLRLGVGSIVPTSSSSEKFIGFCPLDQASYQQHLGSISTKFVPNGVGNCPHARMCPMFVLRSSCVTVINQGLSKLVRKNCCFTDALHSQGHLLRFLS